MRFNLALLMKIEALVEFCGNKRGAWGGFIGNKKGLYDPLLK